MLSSAPCVLGTRPLSVVCARRLGLRELPVDVCQSGGWGVHPPSTPSGKGVRVSVRREGQVGGGQGDGGLRGLLCGRRPPEVVGGHGAGGTSSHCLTTPPLL